MNAALAVVTSLAVLAAAPAAAATEVVDVVRAGARPELPWVTAVLAPATPLDEAGAATFAKAESSALADVGARVRVETLEGHTVVVVDGPPEAHDTIVKTARKAGASVGGGVLFVDGRTALVDKGALPRASPPASPSTATTATATTLVMPLAPSPGLLDVEGEALAMFVESILDGLELGPVDARATTHALVVHAHVPALVDTKANRDRARAALDAALAAPLTARRVEELRTKARAVVAERRAKAGGWARDMAAMWLASGTLDVEEPTDLGSALRARLFPSVLFR